MPGKYLVLYNNTEYSTVQYKYSISCDTLYAKHTVLWRGSIQYGTVLYKKNSMIIITKAALFPESRDM